MSESSNYASCLTDLFINIINVLLPSQIVINEHPQELNVSFAFQRNEFFRIVVEKFQIFVVVGPFLITVENNKVAFFNV